MLGLTEQFIDESCPYVLQPYDDAYKLKLKASNEQYWLQGIYVLNALQATVGNLFTKSRSQMNEYPKRPHDFFGDKKVVDPEANEKLAAAEMFAYMKALEREGRLSKS